MKVRFIFRPSESTAAVTPGAIICRITVDKARKKFTTPVTCLRRDWDAKAQRVKGTAKKARLDNSALSDIEAEINRLYYDFERAHELVTAEILFAAYQAKDKPRVTLARAAELWHEQRHALVGKTIAQPSYKDYQNKTGLLLMFLRGQNMAQAVPDQFTENLCDLFIIWMRSERGVSQNYTNKTVQVIKQFLKWCKRHKHAKTNPLEHYSLKFEATAAPKFLQLADIRRLQQYAFSSLPLRRIADVFLFQCYTGLAYADLKRFDAKRDVGLGEDGEPWIFMGRQKTVHSSGQQATIPLLEEARELLKTYGTTLPVPTNQVYNRMLKEVGAVVGLSLVVTSHIGRKTAGRLWLDAGISMAAVSKALGHRTVAMTERYYVRVGESLVAREFGRAYGKRKNEADDEQAA